MYVAVKGGERAIRNAHALLADVRRGDRATPEIAPAQIDGWVRDQLLSNKILAKVDPGGDPTSQVANQKFSALLVKASDAMKIQLNPRYGTWSARRGVTPLISGGLSKTAAQLKASANK